MNTDAAVPSVMASVVLRTVVLGLVFSLSSRKNLALCTETSVHIYNVDSREIGEMKTRINPQALFSLSGNGTRLAYPISETIVGVSDDRCNQLLQIDVGCPFGKLQVCLCVFLFFFCFSSFSSSRTNHSRAP